MIGDLERFHERIVSDEMEAAIIARLAAIPALADMNPASMRAAARGVMVEVHKVICR